MGRGQEYLWDSAGEIRSRVGSATDGGDTSGNDTAGSDGGTRRNRRVPHGSGAAHDTRRVLGLSAKDVLLS